MLSGLPTGQCGKERFTLVGGWSWVAGVAAGKGQSLGQEGGGSSCRPSCRTQASPREVEPEGIDVAESQGLEMGWNGAGSLVGAAAPFPSLPRPTSPPGPVLHFVLLFSPSPLLPPFSFPLPPTLSLPFPPAAGSLLLTRDPRSAPCRSRGCELESRTSMGLTDLSHGSELPEGESLRGTTGVRTDRQGPVERPLPQTSPGVGWPAPVL